MGNLELASRVQEAMSRLGFVFLKNESEHVTEFEVRSPCQFLVVVEDVSGPSSKRPRNPKKGESALDLKPLIGSSSTTEEVKRCADAMAKEIRSLLPPEPWRGTGIFRSRAVKEKWERLWDLP